MTKTYDQTDLYACLQHMVRPCDVCDGSGYVSDEPEYASRCPRCRGTGRCYRGGNGRWYSAPKPQADRPRMSAPNPPPADAQTERESDSVKRVSRPRVRGYFEDYACGCVSEIVRYKKDLLGYCGQHGDSRRYVWPDVEWLDPKVSERGAADLPT